MYINYNSDNYKGGNYPLSHKNLNHSSHIFLNCAKDLDHKAKHNSYSFVILSWSITSERLGTMDHLHLRIISNLAAKSMCITSNLLFCGKSIIPILRIASDGEGLVIIPVTLEIRVKTLFQKEGI